MRELLRICTCLSLLISMDLSRASADPAPNKCVDLSGTYHREIGGEGIYRKDYLLIKQNGCESLSMHFYYGKLGSGNDCEDILTIGKSQDASDLCLKQDQMICQAGCKLKAQFVPDALEL